MFKIADNPTFTHTVDIDVPADGGSDKQSIKVTFKVLPANELAEFDTSKNEGQKDFLRAVIVKLDDLVGEDDKPLPYNDRLRDHLFELFYVRIPLMNAYSRAMVIGRLGN